MAAVIGALRVDLGLNSAEFQAGLKKAQTGLGNFAKIAGVGLAAVATAAAAAGTALGYAVKGAIDNADQMGELAQSVGVSVEALTSLGYAAKMSGSDTEALATSLRKLSQNMLAVAQGSTGPVATAFNALGISVQNANGSLRSSDQVLIDVADKFARMEDGAQKTALAVQLFGRSGAEMIPFLNQGRSGLSALTAEADRLGVTISGKTANAAGEFNDTLDRLTATFDGVINKVMAGALPALQRLGNTLADPKYAAAAQQLGGAIVNAMDVSAQAVLKVVEALNLLRTLQPTPMGMSPGNTFVPFSDAEGSAKRAIDEVRNELTAGTTSAVGPDFFTGIFGATAPEIAASAEQVAVSFEPVITNTQAAGAASAAASDAASKLNAVMAEGRSVFEATRTPAEAYGLEVERLNKLLQQGAIDQDTYNRAVTQAQDAFEKADTASTDLASSLSSGLADVFGSIIDGSKSAVEALGDLIGSLGKMLLHKGFEALIGGMFGGGGGNIFSGLLGGIGKNANGTNNWRGGLTMVGERGPELINLNRGSQVISNSDLQNMGGTSVMQVQLSPDLEARILQQAAGQTVKITGQQISQNNKQLPGMLREINQRTG